MTNAEARRQEFPAPPEAANANSGRGLQSPTGPDRGPPIAAASRSSTAAMATSRHLCRGLLRRGHPKAPPPQPPPPQPPSAARRRGQPQIHHRGLERAPRRLRRCTTAKPRHACASAPPLLPVRAPTPLPALSRRPQRPPPRPAPDELPLARGRGRKKNRPAATFLGWGARLCRPTYGGSEAGRREGGGF
nr:uncharacterized protein LOC127321287 [Lolium perenne]